jgi:hypothetical protein
MNAPKDSIVRKFKLISRLGMMEVLKRFEESSLEGDDE